MSLSWNIGNNDIADNFDPDVENKEIEEIENIEKNNPYLPNYLLDIKLYQQLHELESTEKQNKQGIKNKLIQLYNDIDKAIIATREEVLIMDSFDTQRKEYDEALGTHLIRILEMLQDRGSLDAMKGETFPQTANEQVNTLLYQIQAEIDEVTPFPEDASYLRSLRSDVSKRKYRIRQLLKQLPLAVSAESHEMLKCMQSIQKVHNMKRYHFVEEIQMAVCPSYYASEKASFQDSVEAEAQQLFSSYPTVDDFENNGNETASFRHKSDIINDYLEARRTNANRILDTSNYTKKCRKYFEGHNRCLAIMKFSDSTRNMFSISGTELKPDRRYNGAFQNISNTIQTELQQLIGENYNYCRQTDQVKRYMHKVQNNPNSQPQYVSIPAPELLANDVDWYDHQGDYSCCERKMLAQLDIDNSQYAKPYPTNIWLYTRLPVCDNCQSGLDEYEKLHNANFDMAI